MNAPTRVVLVDDDVALRQLVKLLLERDGRFAVVGQAGDGLEGLDVIGVEDPDLVVLDLAMPRFDGLQVLERLEGAPRPRVAVLTGFSDEALCEQVLRAGARRCLRKGVDFAALPDHLAEVVAEV
ncbi:response regulator transcription factor [Nitriliruptoraceae bacterium ZYF776]|nr:response regulator transcription factor [Profundirhabdus halotolerans]